MNGWRRLLYVTLLILASHIHLEALKTSLDIVIRKNFTSNDARKMLLRACKYYYLFFPQILALLWILDQKSSRLMEITQKTSLNVAWMYYGLFIWENLLFWWLDNSKLALKLNLTATIFIITAITVLDNPMEILFQLLPRWKFFSIREMSHRNGLNSSLRPVAFALLVSHIHFFLMVIFVGLLNI